MEHINIQYNLEENLYYADKNEIKEILVETLCVIFKSMVSTNRIFNIELLIRQNFLTICETPEYMESLFGIDTLFCKESDEEENYFLSITSLKDDVINEVMDRMGFVDLDIDEFTK